MQERWSHLGETLIERWTHKFIQRRFLRRRVCLEAIITPLVMNRPMPCTVLDLSEGGANLRVSLGALIPARFELAIPSRRERYRCRLVWRTLDTLGVEFLARREGRHQPGPKQQRKQPDRARGSQLGFGHFAGLGHFAG